MPRRKDDAGNFIRKPKYWTVPPEGWNPDVYVIDPATGEPRTNSAGKPTLRRGPRRTGTGEAPTGPTGSTDTGAIMADALAEVNHAAKFLPPGSQTEPAATPSATPESGGAPDATGDALPTPEPVASAATPLTDTVVSVFVGAGCMVFGSDFAPKKPEEIEPLKTATGRYLETLDAADIPPWAVVLLAFGGYTVAKMAEPSVRAKAAERYDQIRARLRPRRPVAVEASEDPKSAPTAPPAPPKVEPSAEVRPGNGFSISPRPVGE